MGKYKICFTSSFYCTLLERESCVGEMAVIGGGVFGVMSLVIVSLVTVLLTLICKR